MRIIVAALHGILTDTTDASWPDRFESWLLEHDPEVHVEKRKYAAGPWPRWNCWVEDPRLAKGLANELEAVNRSRWPIYFVAHSNGTVIALRAAKLLLQRGVPVAGLILTGGACEADVARSGVLPWYSADKIGLAAAYSSEDDQVVAGDPRAPGEKNIWERLRDWLWGRLMWPYGCLGRTGWMQAGESFNIQHATLNATGIFTRWYRGGHSTYFTAVNREMIFAQMYRDILAAEGRRDEATNLGLVVEQPA